VGAPVRLPLLLIAFRRIRGRAEEVKKYGPRPVRVSRDQTRGDSRGLRRCVLARLVATTSPSSDRFSPLRFLIIQLRHEMTDDEVIREAAEGEFDFR
jgi:hypothetical protein